MSAPRSLTGRSGPTSWGSGAPATSRPPPTTSRPWPPSSEGVAAGALGFSTSRTIAHRAIDGEPVPGTFAAEDELFGIGRVLGELGTGVFELAAAGVLGEDLAAPEREVAWMRRLAAETGRPVTFALNQNNADPDQWRKLLDLAERGRSPPGPGAAPGDGPHGVHPHRLPDLPPVARSRPHGPRRCSAWPRGRSRSPASRPSPSCAAGCSPKPPTRSTATRWCKASCRRSARTSWATRRTTSPPRPTAWPAWPRPWERRCGTRSSTCSSATGARNSSTRRS